MFKFIKKIINKTKKQNFFAAQCVDGKEHSWTREFQFVDSKSVETHNTCRFCDLRRRIYRKHNSLYATVTCARFGEVLINGRMKYEDVINGRLPSEKDLR